MLTFMCVLVIELKLLVKLQNWEKLLVLLYYSLKFEPCKYFDQYSSIDTEFVLWIEIKLNIGRHK